MALNEFSRELLEFIYLLTQQKRLLTTLEMASLMKVSERTVRRWLTFLKKHCFDYYPYVDCRSLGLTYFEVLLSDVTNEKIYSIIPHSVYVMKGHDLSNYVRPHTIISFWISDKSVKAFKAFWQMVGEAGLAKARVMRFEPPVEYYPPFHELLDSHGAIKSDRQFDFRFFSETAGKTREAQKLDPLFIPIVFELFRENWNARMIWLNAKTKLKKDSDSYFRKVLGSSDDEKIFIVREKLKFLQENFDDFFSQIRVSYAPMIYRPDRIAATVYFDYLLDFNGLAESVASKIILLNIRKGEKRHSFYFVTSASGFREIIHELAKAGCENIQTIIRDISATDYYNKKRKFVKFPYWKLFDPVKKEWKFDSRTYLDELKKLGRV